MLLEVRVLVTFGVWQGEVTRNGHGGASEAPGLGVQFAKPYWSVHLNALFSLYITLQKMLKTQKIL